MARAPRSYALCAPLCNMARGGHFPLLVRCLVPPTSTILGCQLPDSNDPIHRGVRRHGRQCSEQSRQGPPSLVLPVVVDLRVGGLRSSECETSAGLCRTLGLDGADVDVPQCNISLELLHSIENPPDHVDLRPTLEYMRREMRDTVRDRWGRTQSTLGTLLSLSSQRPAGSGRFESTP